MPSQGRVFRRVLVVSGGGAKGAYSFGCMQALRDRGFTFDAISGTSAGALNSLLWATDSLDEGRSLWSSLSFDNFLPVRISGHLPKKIRWLVGTIYVVLRIVAEILAFRPLPSELRKYFLYLFAAAATLGLPIAVCAVTIAICEEGSRARSIDLLVGFVSAFALSAIFAMVLRSGRYRAYKDYVYLPLVLTAYFFCWGLPVSVALGQGCPVGREPGWIDALAGVGGLLTGRFIEGLFVVVLASGPGIFASSKLREIVEDLIRLKRFRIPCIVTATKCACVWDPDKNDWTADPGDTVDGVAKPWTTWYPQTQTIFVPVYTCVEGLTHSDAVQRLLASAALPLGLIDSVTIGGEEFVDGGVVDNTPIFPFIETFPAQEIFVLFLEHFENDDHAMAEATRCLNRWPELDHAIRLQEVEIPRQRKGRREFEAQMKRSPEPNLPYRKLPNTPKLVPFYPSEKTIGKFFSGTLNFDSKYSENMRELGYRDTVATIERHNLRSQYGDHLR